MPVIEFLCPNGHKIHCQDDQAGRAAKCPRCGVKFYVPDSLAAGPPEVADFDSSISSFDWANLGMAEPAPPAAETAGPKEPQIEFLCPNGHRLHGPASLQGRPGACPECNSRFRIPSYDDVSAEEEPEKEISIGRIDGGEGSDVGKRTAPRPVASTRTSLPTRRKGRCPNSRGHRSGAIDRCSALADANGTISFATRIETGPRNAEGGLSHRC